MDELVLGFKRGIGVVSNLCIYNTSSDISEYSDTHGEDDIRNIQKMRQLNCLEDLDHLLLETNEKKYLFVKKGILISIIELNDKTIENYVILIHKTKLFLEEFSNSFI